MIEAFHPIFMNAPYSIQEIRYKDDISNITARLLMQDHLLYYIEKTLQYTYKIILGRITCNFYLSVSVPACRCWGDEVVLGLGVEGPRLPGQRVVVVAAQLVHRPVARQRLDREHGEGLKVLWNEILQQYTFYFQRFFLKCSFFSIQANIGSSK